MDTAVVFGRACGTASTTFPGEKTHGKNNKTNAKAKENIQNTQSWAESPPFATPCHKKIPKRYQKQPRRAKGTQKGDTTTPKSPQRIPKGGQRAPEASQKAPKSDKKTEKEGMTKTSKNITF